MSVAMAPSGAYAIADTLVALRLGMRSATGMGGSI
jgi:hypothetical protein